MATPVSVDLAAIRGRHPHHFGGSSRERRLVLALGAGALLLLLVGMGAFGFFGSTFCLGLGKLGEVVGLIIPPNPGSWTRAGIFAMSLVETIAISFLGTLCAAILAVPLSLLAANNVMTMKVV